MATKLKLLATLLLLSLTAFSQKDTSKKDTCKITIPCSTASKIAVDLVRGDSVSAELKLTQDLLRLKDSELSYYEGIIHAYVKKDENYRNQLSSYTQIDSKQQYVIKGLEKDNRILKRNVRILGFGVGITSLAAIVGFILP